MSRLQNFRTARVLILFSDKAKRISQRVDRTLSEALGTASFCCSPVCPRISCRLGGERYTLARMDSEAEIVQSIQQQLRLLDALFVGSGQ